MNVNELIAALGADFFTGVPDSKLRPLVDYLMDTYGSGGPSHIIAANEGSAAALAIISRRARRRSSICRTADSATS